MKHLNLNLKAIEIVAGIITEFPTNGEEVLIHYNNDGFELVNFFVQGTVMTLGLNAAAKTLSPEERLVARMEENPKFVQQFKVDKTGFYKCYPGNDKDGNDSYQFINSSEVSHWMRLPTLG